MHNLRLYFQQTSQRLGGLLAWLAVWTGLSLLFAYVFNSLSGSAGLADTFEQLPGGLRDAINIDPTAYTSRIESFLSGQMLFVYLLAGSIFAFSLGVGAVGRRIRNRTIANLLSLPLARGRLYLALLASNITTLLLAAAILGPLQYLIFKQLTEQPDISGAYFAALHIGSTAVFMLMMALGQLIGSLFPSGRALPVGAAFIVISWFVNTLSGITDLPEWFRRLSVFSYFDITRLRDQSSLDPLGTALLLAACLAVALLGALYFKRKNLYL